MSTARNVKNCFSVLPNRRNDGYIRKMTPSGNRMIGQQDITHFQRFSLQFDLLPDCLAHGPKMHRLMRSVGHQSSRFIKNSTGKIVSFLDVCGNRGALESASHLLGNRHKQVAENGHLNWISLSSNFPESSGFNTQYHITVFRNFRGTSGFNKNR